LAILFTSLGGKQDAAIYLNPSEFKLIAGVSGGFHGEEKSALGQTAGQPGVELQPVANPIEPLTNLLWPLKRGKVSSKLNTKIDLNLSVFVYDCIASDIALYAKDHEVSNPSLQLSLTCFRAYNMDWPTYS